MHAEHIVVNQALADGIAGNTSPAIPDLRANSASRPAARKSMLKLAKAYEPKVLAERCFGLYEQFRPAIPASIKGWGATGNLDLDVIESLVPKR